MDPSINKRRSIESAKQPSKVKKLDDSGKHGRPSIPRLTVKVKVIRRIKSRNQETSRWRGTFRNTSRRPWCSASGKIGTECYRRQSSSITRARRTNKPLGIVDFNKVDTNVIVDDKDDKSFKITMRGQEKEIILKASSDEEAAKWVKKMEKMIKVS